MKEWQVLLSVLGIILASAFGLAVLIQTMGWEGFIFPAALGLMVISLSVTAAGILHERRLSAEEAEE